MIPPINFSRAREQIREGLESLTDGAIQEHLIRSQSRRKSHLIQAGVGLAAAIIDGFFVEPYVPKGVRSYCDYAFFAAIAYGLYHTLRYAGANFYVEESQSILKGRGTTS